MKKSLTLSPIRTVDSRCHGRLSVTHLTVRFTGSLCVNPRDIRLRTSDYESQDKPRPGWRQVYLPPPTLLLLRAVLRELMADALCSSHELLSAKKLCSFCERSCVVLYILFYAKAKPSSNTSSLERKRSYSGHPSNDIDIHCFTGRTTSLLLGIYCCNGEKKRAVFPGLSRHFSPHPSRHIALFCCCLVDTAAFCSGLARAGTRGLSCVACPRHSGRCSECKSEGDCGDAQLKQ